MVFLYRSHILVSIPYRLATNRDGGKEKKMIRMFQFLIGWLQTLLQMLCLLTGPQAVSIPYRLATNSDFTTAMIDEAIVFQFLIGWLQTCS